LGGATSVVAVLFMMVSSYRHLFWHVRVERGIYTPSGAGEGSNCKERGLSSPLKESRARAVQADQGSLVSVLSTSVTKQTGDMVYSGARRLRILSIWAHATMLHALERDSDYGSTSSVLIELSERGDVSSGPVP